jgi:hypothetical protein
VFSPQTILIKNNRFSLLLLFPGYSLYAKDVADKSVTEQIWLNYNAAIALTATKRTFKRSL